MEYDLGPIINGMHSQTLMQYPNATIIVQNLNAIGLH